MQVINDKNPNYPVLLHDKLTILGEIGRGARGCYLPNGRLIKERCGDILNLAEVHCDKVSALAGLGSLNNDLVVRNKLDMFDRTIEVIPGFISDDLSAGDTEGIKEFEYHTATRDETNSVDYYNTIDEQYHKVDKRYNSYLSKSMRNIRLEDFCIHLESEFDKATVESFLWEYLKTHYFQMRDTVVGNNFMIVTKPDRVIVNAGYDYECTSMFFRDGFDKEHGIDVRQAMMQFFGQKLPNESLTFIKSHFQALWNKFVSQIREINGSNELRKLCSFDHLGETLGTDQERLSHLGNSLFTFYDRSTENFK
jgi:hypothetical protein